MTLKMYKGTSKIVESVRDKTNKIYPIAQLVASVTADQGIASLMPAWSHTFVEIDHEIIFTVILLPKKGCCQLQAKVWAPSTG